MKLMILSHNKVLGINKEDETFKDMAENNEEEAKELKEALESEDLLKIGEETLDQIQVCIGILDKLASEGIDIDQLAKRHNKKLVMRNWREKGVVNIHWKTNV